MITLPYIKIWCVRPVNTPEVIKRRAGSFVKTIRTITFKTSGHCWQPLEINRLPLPLSQNVKLQIINTMKIITRNDMDVK